MKPKLRRLAWWSLAQLARGMWGPGVRLTMGRVVLARETVLYQLVTPTVPILTQLNPGGPDMPPTDISLGGE